MMSAPSKWYRNQAPDSKPAEEELFIFGYSCKIFRDDEKATYIDQGKHLIPWMGDETLMIDRYDVRGYLHDLAPYEANPKNDYSEEQSEEEKLCDEERYLALNTDLTEEELYHEEELKRLRAAVASDGAYHEIGFSYDSIENEDEKTETTSVKDEPEDEPYSPPAGLKVPKGMHAPYNMKIHTIIEKTALFVSQQGGQMEIIIKMKQSNNPQFAFMQFDNPLYPYYRHLLQEIKNGHYKPVFEKKVSESDDEHHDDHYLHPSLSGAAESVPKFTVPSINFRRTGDDSYSLLVKNLKDRIEYDQQRNSPTVQIDSSAAHNDDEEAAHSENVPSNGKGSEAKRESSVSSSDSDDSLSTDSDEDSDVITPPPPDVKPVIDKMAEYVAKNGTDFETIVKSKNDKRFEFLKHGNKFYNYYMFRKKFLSEKIAAEAKASAASGDAENAQMSPREQPPLNEPEAAKLSVEPANVQNCNSNDNDAVSQTPQLTISTTSEEPSNELVCEPDTTVNTKPPQEEQSSKPKTPVKVMKGPISFSLKPKEAEVPLLEKPKAPALLLDDSEEEDELGSENKSSGKSAVIVTDKRVQPPAPVERKVQSLVSEKKVQHPIVPVHQASPKSNSIPPENEERSKKLSSEEIEAKIAEDKMKDKLAAAVRERLTQQKRDKQLQLERKQRAAMFLKMLQKKKSDDTTLSESIEPEPSVADNSKPKSATGTPEIKIESLSSPSLCERNSPKDIPSSSSVAQPSPVASVPEGETWSSSDSETAARLEELIEAPCNEQTPEVTSSQEVSTKPKKRKKSLERKHKSKSHKTSKKHKRSRSRSPSHKNKRSKSRKEKKLPAAYAVFRRSRSKSRSPLRHSTSARSQSPSYVFNRWR